tara:strand:+ start:6055 stop:6771 length:717 start_codon:yes stop_codon:yes gene_type:complete
MNSKPDLLSGLRFIEDDDIPPLIPGHHMSSTQSWKITSDNSSGNSCPACDLGFEPVAVSYPSMHDLQSLLDEYPRLVGKDYAVIAGPFGSGFATCTDFPTGGLVSLLDENTDPDETNWVESLEINDPEGDCLTDEDEDGEVLLQNGLFMLTLTSSATQFGSVSFDTTIRRLTDEEAVRAAGGDMWISLEDEEFAPFVEQMTQDQYAMFVKEFALLSNEDESYEHVLASLRSMMPEVEG